MGSTSTPLRHQKSVKFHTDDKPLIKITVSSDALAETILKNNVSSSSSSVVEEDGLSSTDGDRPQQQQQPALIQIVGNCCNSTSSSSSSGSANGSANGVLCSCANGDDKRTRIALDDFTVLEFPNCIDFGIKDFLCCKDEIELDLSSDTDASFLDATPPHRFSDSELENQIEAMSITLDTQLNPFPEKALNVVGSPDEEEEETTEDSFIMDDEEASSSASNSAATICGGGDLEHDDHFSAVSSSDPLTQVSEQHQHGSSGCTLSKGDSEEDAFQQSLSSTVEDEGENTICNSIPITNTFSESNGGGDDAPGLIKGENDDEIPEIGRERGDGGGGGGESGKELLIMVETKQKAANANPVIQDEENGSFGCKEHFDSSFRAKVDTPSPPPPPPPGKTNEAKPQAESISRKMLKHPTKQFKRQISLPASIFMTYLIEQNNKANYCKQQQQQNQQNSDNMNCHRNCDIIAKNKLNRSNSCNHRNNKGSNGLMMGMRPSLSKINSHRSSKVIHGSTEDYEDDDINNSNSFSDTNEDYVGLEGGQGVEDGDDDDDNSLSGTKKRNNWGWESTSDTFTQSKDPQEESDDERQAFTSEVEKRSLILRHVRRLIRQDTTGNFAPPDFSI